MSNTHQLTTLFKNCIDELAEWQYISQPDKQKAIDLVRINLSEYNIKQDDRRIECANYYRVMAINQCALIANGDRHTTIKNLCNTLENGLSTLVDN